MPCCAVSFSDQLSAMPCRVIFVAFILHAVPCRVLRLLRGVSCVPCHCVSFVSCVSLRAVSWRVMLEGLMYREREATFRGVHGGGRVLGWLALYGQRARPRNTFPARSVVLCHTSSMRVIACHLIFACHCVSYKFACHCVPCHYLAIGVPCRAVSCL